MPKTRSILSVLLLVSSLLTDTSAQDSYVQITKEDQPVAYWRMDKNTDGVYLNSAGEDPLTLAAKVVGTIKQTELGPTLPEFPLFASGHAAVEITTPPGRLVVTDPGDQSPLDFKKGDPITIEAWVNSSGLQNNGYRYIVGKGRTGNKGFPAENQNYSLRLSGKGGAAYLSFLMRGTANGKQDYHRWESKTPVGVGDGWHYVVITYIMGTPNTLRGFIDGKLVAGTWEVAGDIETTPVVDNDELWIGTSLGGNPNSTFHGSLDEIAIYRKLLPADRIAQKYEYRGQELTLDTSLIKQDKVRFEVYENISDSKSWSMRAPVFLESYDRDDLVLFRVPHKYTQSGVIDDRPIPFMVRAMGRFVIPKGTQQILVRARNGARLQIDDAQVLDLPFFNISSSSHGSVPAIDRTLAPHIRPLYRGDAQKLITIEGDGEEHLFVFDMIVGGKGRRPECGESGVYIAPPGEDFRVLGHGDTILLTDYHFPPYFQREWQAIEKLNQTKRIAVSKSEAEYWNNRHKHAAMITQLFKPLSQAGNEFPERSNNLIDRYLNDKLAASELKPTTPLNDRQFLRKLSLDTTGTIPSPEVVSRLLKNETETRRQDWIDFFLSQDAWADHWVSYWQDVLAENPNIVNPTLNNTGPFRLWIYEALLDNRPIDQMVTQLIMMEGSKYFGGPAGFELATQNDAPMAAKAHVLTQAFLGVQMKCARCHDAPFHESTQQDLFEIAAMLKRGPQVVPSTSSVPLEGINPEDLAVTISVKPGTSIQSHWPLENLASDRLPAELVRYKEDSRAQLARIITQPLNMRFSQVIANRMWKKLIGYGLREPINDWQDSTSSHPHLLDFLARELAGNGYDLKRLARTIFESDLYQRTSTDLVTNEDGHSLFAGPVTRRLSAEQLVDSLFSSSGQPFDAGAMSVDIDGARRVTNSLHLGFPRRAWQFSDTSNERDRPSLTLPFAQPFVTVMELFGWNGARQSPISQRQDEMNVLQPAILHNGILAQQITTLTVDSNFTQIALQSETVNELLDSTFQHILGRTPSIAERDLIATLVADGFESRVVDLTSTEREEMVYPDPAPRNLISWSNHNSKDANSVKLELRKYVKAGPKPTPELNPQWRTQMEDLVWALYNSPEFVFSP